jgi:phosphoesterase RecJ-like protein
MLPRDECPPRNAAVPIDWTPFVELVRRHQRFLLMTHVRPDGDALGSQLAFADALLALGKQPRVVIASRLPPRYDFLNSADLPIEEFHNPGDGFRATDAVVILDTGTWNQLGDFGPFMQTLDVPKAVVDHHRTQDDLGGLALVDVTAEATGRLVHEAINALGVPVSARAAHCMFVALAMDTGWFRHPSTTARTLDLAAELVRAGARPDRIYEDLYEHSTLPRLKLLARALERLQVLAGGRVAYTEVYLRDYAATAAVPQDTEDLIAYTRSLEGVEVGLLFIEQPAGGVKVSFRSHSRVDVGGLAERFGGGGHRLASGATVAGELPDVRARVLEAVLPLAEATA